MNTFTISICADCLAVSANGVHGQELPEGFAERYADMVARHGGSEPHHITDEFGELRSHFSWEPCNYCGDSLGGERYLAVINIERETA